MDQAEILKTLWTTLYPESNPDLLESFLSGLEIQKKIPENKKKDWYKDAVVYSLYIDQFNKDIPGLINKLDYLKDLGINCLWLLPMLESPMRDAGFDIADYYSVRKDLLSAEDDGQTGFRQFLKAAHQRQITVIFDVAMNHTSDQHPWFKEAVKSTDNPFHNYYIWTKDIHRYSSARIIFKGIEESNWEKYGDEWYFHRFFNFQPDLNYRNPEVLLAMCEVLLFWQKEGVDGFRMDAVPYIWKEENTDCENLPNTHLIVKFFRAMLDFVKPGSLLLAEACQQPAKVVEYLGQGDECHAAYHFPLMPRIFMALALKNGDIIKETLSPAFTPLIPSNTQWFTFLRCHDELSLERVYVTEEERAFIHKNYCYKPSWDFRVGEGISARLSELLNRNPAKILLAFSIMLTLPGTPVIYYGDEFAILNDEEYYKEIIAKTGKDDSRFLVRGRINWNDQQQFLQDHHSLSYRVFTGLKKMIMIRNQHAAFGRGNIQFIDIQCNNPSSLFAYCRKFEDQEILILHNLGEEDIVYSLPESFKTSINLIEGTAKGHLNALSYQWFNKI